MKLLVGLLVAVTCLLEARLVIGQYSRCRDKLDSYTCQNWYSMGMCNDYSYRFLMVENCQRTCNLCLLYGTGNDVTEVCADTRRSCHKWRRHCKVESDFYDFMTENCPRTCLFCEDKSCTDKKSRCERYLFAGYCDENNIYYHFMRKNCEKTCRFCMPPEDKETKAKKEIGRYEKEYLCDFEEDDCDWSNRHFEDTADWEIGVYEYGPKTGFNSSKSYLYLGAKYHGYYAHIRLPWKLVLPLDQKDKGKMCFHFMYQMSRGCKLTITQRPNPTMENKHPSEVIKFNTEKGATSWTHVKVNVYVSENVELTIKGVKGEPESFLGIDYIFFSKGAC